MTASWPTGWESALLRQIGVVSRADVVRLITAWQRSTPTQPWTSNPLGIPASLGNYPAALPTGYAAFPNMAEFRYAFEQFAKTSKGQNVILALYDTDHPSVLWQAVSKLGWPASATETDYPAYILDMTTESYQKHVGATPAAQRATSGQVGSTSSLPEATGAYSQVAASAANALKRGGQAIASTMRRVTGNGR